MKRLISCLLVCCMMASAVAAETSEAKGFWKKKTKIKLYSGLLLMAGGSFSAMLGFEKEEKITLGNGPGHYNGRVKYNYDNYGNLVRIDYLDYTPDTKTEEMKNPTLAYAGIGAGAFGVFLLINYFACSKDAINKVADFKVIPVISADSGGFRLNYTF